MTQPTLSLDALRQAVERLPDSTLAPVRDAALSNLEERGLPTTRHEDWKYTDLAAAIDISNRWLAAGAPVPDGQQLDDKVDAVAASIDANWLVIRNGRIDTSRFATTEGILVETFSESGAPFVLDRPLADLNAALLLDGLRIRIDAEIAQPIGLLVIDDVADDVGATHSGVEIEVTAGNSAAFVEYHASFGDGDHYANSVVALKLADAARAKYVRIQDRARSHIQTASLSAALDASARLQFSGFDLGGRLVRNDLNIDLPGRDAHVEFDGVFLAGDGQHIDNHTRVDHRVGPASSRQEYRGILGGRCRCVWNGKAIVHEGADGTDAQQANHNLLLSENAEIDAKPELEIYADDVRCSHGTTVGQLDEIALFYLRSRGIDEAIARRMLTQAFATGLVNRVPVEATHACVASLVETRLQELAKSRLT